MDILQMDKEIIKWLVMVIVGGAGWAFALGRKMITNKVIEEVNLLFVKKEIYDLEMKNVQASITALQLEQKANHSDMVQRLDRAVVQINDKVELLMQ